MKSICKTILNIRRITLASIAMIILLCSCSSTILIPQYCGPCVDRAVQVKAYLISEGYKARLVTGYTIVNDEKMPHMWVQYKREGNWKTYDNFSGCESNIN